MDEFQDWEVVHDSEDSGVVNSSDPDDNTRVLGEIEADSEGMIRADYFSIDSENKYARRTVDLSEEAASVESDNPSWIDPGSENRYPRKESGEFWSDSGSDRSDDRKLTEFDAINGLGVVEAEKPHVRFAGIEAEDENSKKFCSDMGAVGSFSIEFGDLEKQTQVGGDDYPNSRRGLELSGEENQVEGSVEVIDKSAEDENAAIESVKSVSEEEKKTAAWWKVSLEFLKYYVFRVSPVWTVSMAAAVMGFLILGRRLYKMKRKTRSLQLNVTVDDKKVSQFMSRAARLNEAFSVVKRVPIIRPTLPVAGVTPWPVMSMR